MHIKLIFALVSHAAIVPSGKSLVTNTAHSKHAIKPKWMSNKLFQNNIAQYPLTIRQVSLDDMGVNEIENIDFSESENYNDKKKMMILPRHPTNEGVNKILSKTEWVLESMQSNSDNNLSSLEKSDMLDTSEDDSEFSNPILDGVYANSYVDLGRVDTVGFDYDYTLVSYTPDLQSLIYDMALGRLVSDKQYPIEMKNEGKLKFDPNFSVRGKFFNRMLKNKHFIVNITNKILTHMRN